MQKMLNSNDRGGAQKLLKRGLTKGSLPTNNPLFGKLLKKKESNPIDGSEDEEKNKDDSNKALTDLFFDNMKLLKVNLEKKRRQ